VPDLAGPRVEHMPRMVRAWARHTGARGPIVTVPAPGPFGKALRDGTLLPRPGAHLGTQTYDEWLGRNPVVDPTRTGRRPVTRGNYPDPSPHGLPTTHTPQVPRGWTAPSQG